MKEDKEAGRQSPADMELCHPILVSSYADGELDPETSVRMTRHIAGCSSCQKRLQENAALSELFKTAWEKPFTVPADTEARVLYQIQKRNMPLFVRLASSVLSKRFLLPAATVITGLMLIFSLITPSSPSGPSAIINSLTGDVSSVIIIETPTAHQTIIWFNEDD